MPPQSRFAANPLVLTIFASLGRDYVRLLFESRQRIVSIGDNNSVWH